MHTEQERRTPSGWALLVLNILSYIVSVYLIITGALHRDLGLMLAGILLVLLSGLLSGGFFVLNPNESAVLLLFGAYRGTARENGFRWTNPFYRRIKISLRARVLNGPKIKVNELSGNPIEIATVVVWQVHDTAKAVFDVDRYIEYVDTQSETALRHLASSYPYDGADHELSLRGNTDDINQHLQKELQERLDRAGVVVIEARLSHLAYAPEIAGEMLRRQQANAIIAARKKIVEGAVGMVEDALRELEENNIIKLDEERRAAMVSNLLVVLCSEQGTQPVVNTGTLYT